MKDNEDYNIFEQKFTGSEKIYRSILENTRDAIIITDFKGSIIYASPQLIKILGGKKVSIGSNWSKFIHPNDINYLLELLKRGSEAKHILFEDDVEFRVLNKEGNYVWISSSSKDYYDGSGNVIGFISSLRDITDKKKAEQKLRESEKKYRNIIENTKDAIVIIDLIGKLLFVSPQLSSLLKGREIKENSRLFTYVHKDDVSELTDYYKSVIKNKSISDKLVEFRIQTQEGNYVWLSSSSKNYFDENGDVIGFISTLKDITDRKVAEQKLRASEQKYRLITENANDLIRVLNENFEIEYFNERAHFKILGYSKEDLIGLKAIALNHPKDYPKIHKFMIKFFKKGEGIHESRIKHKNGSWIWFEIKAKSFKDEDGIQKYLFVSRDITERKIAEKALRESEEKYRHLYENSPIGIVVTDSEGKILEGNVIAAKIFGVEPKQAKGQNFADLGIFTPKQISLIRERYISAYRGINLEPLEIQIRKKDGNMVWIHYQNSVINLEDTILVESIVHNITEKKLAEELIKKENKKLMELSKMKTDLISRVSHELKTPLNSIYGGSQILLNLYKDSMCSEALEFIEMINKGGRRLKSLIENLLDISRIESNKLSLNLQKENLIEIMKECIDDIKYMLNGRQLNLELNFKNTIYIEVDKLRIEQVITNLLSNAIKNTPSYGTISLNLKEANDSIYIEVKDTGVGLTEEDMDKLFKKFGKIERYGQKLEIDTEGSGLGLFISKQIIDLHGGAIWVESEGRNKGSKFIIRLYKKPDFIFV